MRIQRFFSAVLLAMIGTAAIAQPQSTGAQGPDDEFSVIEGTSVLSYNLSREFDIHSRAGYGPVFYIFPDGRLDAASAKKLAQRLGLPDILRQFGGRIMLVNPTSDKWQERDLTAFRQLLSRGSSPTNIKIVGLGSGATFVNNYIAPSDFSGVVAGIVSINGDPGKVCKYPVPAYIGGRKAANTAKPYQAAAAAAPADPLLKVIVNSDSSEPEAGLFADAWNRLLSANYRYNNLYRTFYSSRGIDNPEGVKNFELVSIPDFKRTGMKRIAVEYPLIDVNAPGRPENPDKYLWYEYIPLQAQNAQAGSVPLVVLLHGHGNDPRTQSETSGFVELAAEKGFIAVEMEWQGGNGYVAMGLDGIEAVISVLLKKYPQIDASRIYAEGLSAGAMTSNMLGVRKSHLFAAVAGHSGGIFSGNGIGYYAYGSEPLMNEAIQKRGHVEVGYCSVVGTHDDTIPFYNRSNWSGNPYLNVWRIYETVNGMDVTGNLDFSVDPVFGFVLRDRTVIHTGKSNDITIEFGQLYKDSRPMIRLMVINNYGHWNFKPAAAYIWEFFTHFSRDPETKELKYE
jgi:dienelactone hydrolase